MIFIREKIFAVFIAMMMISSIFLAMAMPINAQPAANKVDIFFLIDGSTSINPNNFTLQLEGIAFTINNSSIVPMDGRLSISIIQFAHSVRKEVPLTTITNQDVADQLASDILNINQIEGGTNIAGAFDMATDNIPSDLTGRQIIILSTDGKPTLGGPVMDARKRSIDAGFDTINTLGVGKYMDETLLQNLAYPQPGFYMHTPNFPEFKCAIKEIIIWSVTPTFIITIDTIGNGTVIRDPDQLEYRKETVVNLRAVPDAGWRFVNWTGNITGTVNPTNIAMDDNKIVTATFELIPTGITVDPSPATLNVTENVTFTATVLPAGANQSVTWSVTNVTGNGTIDATGFFTALSAGIVNVTATSVVDANITETTIITVILKGDINGDRSVTMEDPIHLWNHIREISGFEVIHANGDINSDGVVTIADPIFLWNHIRGISGFEVIH